MRRPLSLLALLAPLALGSALVAGCNKPSAGGEAEAKTYSTKGTIKTFGPDRKYASIAHENIPGYMAAMTMSFEPQTPSQLDGLNPGDKVEFSFKVEGSKHVITSIKKAP